MSEPIESIDALKARVRARLSALHTKGQARARTTEVESASAGLHYWAAERGLEALFLDGHVTFMEGAGWALTAEGRRALACECPEGAGGVPA